MAKKVTYCGHPAEIVRHDEFNDPDSHRKILREYLIIHKPLVDPYQPDGIRLKIDVELRIGTPQGRMGKIDVWSPSDRDWHEVVDIPSVVLPRYEGSKFRHPNMTSEKLNSIVGKDMEKIKNDLIRDACKIIYPL